MRFLLKQNYDPITTSVPIVELRLQLVVIVEKIIFIITVAAWYAKTYRLLFFVGRTSVGHAFNEINQVRQQISRIHRVK